MEFFGGVLVASGEWQIEEVGLAESRLPYDEDVVDCSNRLFQITTRALTVQPATYTCPVGLLSVEALAESCARATGLTGFPTPETPLLYIGNPLIVSRDDDTPGRAGVRAAGVSASRAAWSWATDDLEGAGAPRLELRR
jgi:hypothetical protein